MRDSRRGQDADNPNLNAESKATTTASGSNTHGTVNQHPSASTAPSQAHHSGLSRAAAGSSGRWPFRVGVSEDRNKRWRRTMEDAHAFIYDFGGVRGQGFFSVFDGHAGKHAAEFCGKHFHEHLLNTILENPTLPVPDVLNLTFQTVDRRLSELAKQQGSSSGCTAVAAFLRLETEDGKPAATPETGGVVPSTIEVGSASGPGSSKTKPVSSKASTQSSTSASSSSVDQSNEEQIAQRFRTGSSSHFGGAAAPNAGEDEDNTPQIIRLNTPPPSSAAAQSTGTPNQTEARKSGDSIFSSFTRRLRQYSGDRSASAAAGATSPKSGKRKSLSSSKSPSSKSAQLPTTDSDHSHLHSSEAATADPNAHPPLVDSPQPTSSPSNTTDQAQPTSAPNAENVDGNRNASAEKSEDGLVEVTGKNVRRVLYTANAGDARAVLCRGGKAIRLTYDHKGSDAQETKRIQDAGGFVMNNRVNGVLAVTRSLGDSSMKDFVVGAPYTTETTLGAEDTFLIVACDGLWDVTEDQEAVDLIAEVTDPQQASEILLKHALDNFSTDNTSVMVIRFAVKGENVADMSADASSAPAAGDHIAAADKEGAGDDKGEGVDADGDQPMAKVAETIVQEPASTV
ncbi:mgpp2cl-1, protein phosphatase 2C-like protein 1 [Tilletia horrida]|uniref:Mgpp2cl-1, protein phosphatase 2C-like protein 1 n=1 Tax=Tilletia horrida TaxID=155126 RepID=A0AAN6GUS5_9BASI|nr:mgpp2cl-1, protein phosphatase 2C-like protein 1 [Tilletia horrida]KAK0570196.1 mgpp2cl-1, protein phosphatase 2C-like protein 1 [Tilletia horrida]